MKINSPKKEEKKKVMIFVNFWSIFKNNKTPINLSVIYHKFKPHPLSKKHIYSIILNFYLAIKFTDQDIKIYNVVMTIKLWLHAHVY